MRLKNTFLQDAHHNLRDISPEQGRRSELRQLNEGKIYHKFFWDVQIAFLLLLQQPKSAHKESLSSIFVASKQGLDTSVWSEYSNRRD